ncbi:cilia- and flagella-associated protein 43-like [Calliopsis andreniformis]|uniref:cilia- and flagella-associated protein 43-like n=1 Tax=Calliopsis andreniformis TaxID=337506 RepID=UPI003FCCD54F
MTKDAWKPAWVRGSEIQEIIWIGKEVIAWCTGVHVVFFNVVHQTKSVYWGWNQELGEGARCLAGHMSLPIFCFAEKVVHPRILVYSFPSMTKITECTGGCPTGYLANAFTGKDFLVSVGSYPNFPMIIWYWKTGEKLIAVNTPIRDEVGQILRITQVGPTVIAQMGRTCGQLLTWELEVAGKTVILKDHEINLPKKIPIHWVDWSPTSTDPLLAITDKDAHVYLSNYDGSEINRIVISQRCGVCIDFELPMLRWFREGIILRTTFCQIRFFTKNPKTQKWRKEWYIMSTTRPCFLVAHPVHNNWFFYHTLEGYLMQIDFLEGEEVPEIKKYFDYGAVYRYADFVYPWCHHLVVIDDLKELKVVECYSGLVVAELDPEIEGEINSQASHPDYPLIVLGSTHGELVFVSLIDPNKPKVVASLLLQRRPLDLIKFSHSGKYLLAAEKSTGNCFCVSLQRDKCYTVQALLQYQRTITDALIFESFKRLKVFLLFAGATQFVASQQVSVIDVPEGRNLITGIGDILDLPGLYRSLWQVPGNAMMLIGSPYLTRQLRLQRLQDFKDLIIVDGLMTGHYVRLANLFVDRNWITSTAFDGLVFVRDKTVRRVVTYAMTHHRADFGSVKAIVSKGGNLIVCLGYNGSLVALRSTDEKKVRLLSEFLGKLKLKKLIFLKNDNPPTSTADDSKSICHINYDLYEKQKAKIQSDYASLDPAIQDILTRPKFQFPDPEEGDKTWSEWRDEMQVLEEEEKCKEEKTAIFKDFQVLKDKVRKMLDENEMCPELERLPVSAFDLDITGRDQKLKAGRDECEDMRLQLEHQCSEMNRVAAWIRKTFWDPQEILGKSLLPIFGDREVTNYATVAENLEDQDHLRWALFCKEAVGKIMEDETFQPWRLYDGEELQVELNKRLRLRREEYRRIDLLLDEEEEVEVPQEEVQQEIAMQGANVTSLRFSNTSSLLEGTTTHRYIEASPYYSQIESYGFDHVMLNNCFLTHDCKKLRAHFNEAFDMVYELKEKEMNVIRERAEKIRHIDSELRLMFGQAVSYIPLDPTWGWQERPEGIIKVLDHEVKAKPYISPSQQEILDKEAAEAERIRLLLLADDFRERALMAMMDGVLEVRWEDIIKIDVPKPACMLEKKPEDYNEEDIKTVRQYEKDVQFLQEERERYRRILEVDYVKVMKLMQDGIDNFNEKQDQLFHLKISIEAAINQINLRYIRGRTGIYHRMKALRYEHEVKEKIGKMQEYEVALQADQEIFRNVLQEFLSQRETLINRDKMIAKRFKSEFPTLNKLYVELLERQYTRRPRTNLKNLSASELLELGSHAMSKSRPTHLPSECKDYLKALDNLDVRPTLLPPTIETVHWDHLIKLRRFKIEMELKCKAKEVEIASTEDTIMGFEMRIEKCRMNVEETKKHLDETRKRRVISELDVELQLVLKMGQVEINIAGQLEDTEDAVLVSKSEIDAVNELIRAAGSCKLDALTNLLNFQRGTLLKEWEHECHRKRLEDLQEDLRFLESVTVTKEMQAYLKRRAMGLKDDKTPQQLNTDIEAMKSRFGGIVEGHRARFRSIEKEIATIRSKNEELDRQIFETNVARCEMEQRRDPISEARQQEHVERKIRMFMRRSDLIKKLQDNYAEMLVLQTEHELLRLRRYPMFHFKLIDDSTEKEHTQTPSLSAWTLFLFVME